MKSNKTNNERLTGNEDDVTASKADVNANEKPANDAFKTGGQKFKQEWTQPSDEQQLENTDLSEGSE